MDIFKLKADELRGMDKDELRNTENDIRKEMALVKMNISDPGPTLSSQRRQLKKSLARTLTVMNELKRKK